MLNNLNSKLKAILIITKILPANWKSS